MLRANQDARAISEPLDLTGRDRASSNPRRSTKSIHRLVSIRPELSHQDRPPNQEASGASRSGVIPEHWPGRATSRPDDGEPPTGWVENLDWRVTRSSLARQVVRKRGQRAAGVAERGDLNGHGKTVPRSRRTR